MMNTSGISYYYISVEGLCAEVISNFTTFLRGVLRQETVWVGGDPLDNWLHRDLIKGYHEGPEGRARYESSVEMLNNIQRVKQLLAVGKKDILISTRSFESDRLVTFRTDDELLNHPRKALYGTTRFFPFPSFVIYLVTSVEECREKILKNYSKSTMADISVLRERNDNYVEWLEKIPEEKKCVIEWTSDLSLEDQKQKFEVLLKAFPPLEKHVKRSFNFLEKNQRFQAKDV